MRPFSIAKTASGTSIFLILCLLLLAAAQAVAQQATAKIVGTVTDEQGLVVQGVKVTVTNVATNVSSETTTDKGGFYQVLNLPIGVYNVTASHEGFRELEVKTSPLEINQSLRVDLKLRVGAASEKVMVEGAVEGVETVNPTIGQSVTSRAIVNMPLNGRDVLQLALLQPGVTEDNPDDFSTSKGFNIGGGRTDSVTYLLDGGLNNDLIDNGVVLDPNPDSIEEFRILTSNYTAEYGRSGAGVISVVTKSGTNGIHGSAFDYVRNTDFDANSYFNIEDGFPRNDLKRHQFGGTLGGPITVPHLLDGKDRFFFFVAYQGQKQTQTLIQPDVTTFTPAELGCQAGAPGCPAGGLPGGDFSHAVPDGGSVVLSNGKPGPTCTNAAGCPDTNVVNFLKKNTYFQSNAGKAAMGIIDPTRIDLAAQKYISTFNLQSITSPSGSITSAQTETNNDNELTIKLDFNLTQKDKLSATLGGFRNPLFEPFPNADVPGYPARTQNNNYLANFAYTRTFSPTLLNESRVTAQRRYSLTSLPPTNQTTGAAMGFGIASDLPNGPPILSFDSGLTTGQSPYGPTTFAGVTYAYSNTLTWVQGPNTWKFGVGFSAYQQNTLYDYFGDSDFSYAGYASGGDGTGNSFADFLVGAPNNLFEGADAKNNIRSKAIFGFVQDEWRARKNLIISLGLRYEYSTPKIDTQGRSFSIVPGDQSTRFPNAPLGLVFPGDPGAPRGANFPDKDNFGPRFGFAWSPGSNAKTSIRGGVGVFYDVLKGEDNLQFNGAPPFYSEPYVNFTCLQPVVGCTTLPIVTAQQQFQPGQPTVWTNCPAAAGLPFDCQPWPNSTTPFAANPFPSPGANPNNAFNTCANSNYTCPFYNFLPAAGGSIFFVNPHLHTPYTYQYNLSVQHEIARNLVTEINYVGSDAKGLTSIKDINPFILSTVNVNDPKYNYCATNSKGAPTTACPTRLLNEFQNNSMVAYCLANSAAFFYRGRPFDGQSACPFQNVSEFENISFANFNSLEASLTKQNGVSHLFGNTYFTFGYTLGHSIDNSSGFRQSQYASSQVPYYNPNEFRASSSFDIRQRVTFSGGWDLPFAEEFADAPKRLVKGWSLYPIFSWRTGFPLTINSGLVDSFYPGDPGPSGAGDGYLANANYAPGFTKIPIMNARKVGSCVNPYAQSPNETGNLYFNCSAFQPVSDTPGSGYGNTGRSFFRGPGRTNLDLAVAKSTPITERVNSEFRVEAFNLFNHAEFDNPNTNIFSNSFGQITDTDIGILGNHTERIVQLALRLTF